MGLFEKIKKIFDSEGNQNSPEPNNSYNSDVAGTASPFGKKLDKTSKDKQELVLLLTPREYQLYLLLLQGFTLKESAQQLSVKYSTANTHMNGIYRKLCVNSRAELIINYRDIL
jgi:DNA-binding CsgD family transcriptional regulator